MPRRLLALICLLAVAEACIAARVCFHQRSANAQDVANLWKDDAAQRRLSTAEQLLLDSAGGQYDAYAELLLTFSDGGRLPLFHQCVDLGDTDPQQAIENYRKLTELTDRLIAQRDQAQEVVGQLSDRSDSSDSMDGFWSLQLFSLFPASNVAFFGVDSLIEPGWKFWAWAENARKRARADVLGIAYADPEKNKIHSGEQKMLRERIYQVAKQQFGDDSNVGGSEIEFYQNLKDGKLDHLSQRIHAEMSQDASDAGLTYMTVAATQGKRPIDKVYQEGCEGLKHGVDLYVAAGKAAVTGGLGPSAGQHFEKGWDKAKDACEKIEEAEKEYKKFKEDPTGYLQDKVTEKGQEKIDDFATKKSEELFDQARKKFKGFREGEKFVRDANDLKNEIEEAAKDPKGYLLGKVEGKLKIGDRVNKFLKDKTNLSDDATKFLSEKISENVMEMGRNIVIGEIVDEELKKAGGDPEKVDLKKPLRRIKDAGWDVGAVAVQGKRNGEKSRCTVAVWKDPETGRVKTTLQPVATGGDNMIPLPGDVQADVLAVDEQGRIDTVTETPITVDPEQIVAVDPDDGSTKSVAYDDDLENDDSDSIVTPDNDWTPGSVGATHGLNSVDLTQLYPTDDDSGDTLEVKDYDRDLAPPEQDDIWGGSVSQGDLSDTIHDYPGNDADDWQSIEDDPRWAGDDAPPRPSGDGPTTLSNLADRLKWRPATDVGSRRNPPKWRDENGSILVAPSPIPEEPILSTPVTKNFVPQKWPNPAVFFGKGRTLIPGERPMGISCHIQPRACVNNPQYINHRYGEPEEWRGKRAWVACYQYAGGTRVFQNAWIYVRPLEREDANLLAAAQGSFRFQGSNWPARRLNDDGTILCAYRQSSDVVISDDQGNESSISISSAVAVVSAGGYLAVVRQNSPMPSSAGQRQFLEAVRHQLERAGHRN